MSLAVAGGAAILVPILLLRAPSTRAPLPAPVLVTPPLAIANEIEPLDIAAAAPPFAPSRAPAGAKAEASAEPDTAPTPPAAPPVLVGTISGEGRSVALAKDASGATHALKLGEEVDGWRLVSVQRSAAEFNNGAQRVTIALDYSNRPSPPSSPRDVPAPPLPDLARGTATPALSTQNQERQ